MNSSPVSFSARADAVSALSHLTLIKDPEKFQLNLKTSEFMLFENLNLKT